MKLFCNSVQYITFLAGIAGLIYIIIKYRWIHRQDSGSKNMQKIAQYIRSGAITFLYSEWKILIYFVFLFSIILGWSGTLIDNSSYIIGITFIIGAIASGLSGYMGMMIATIANVKTAQAAKKNVEEAFKISFLGGSIMGIGVSSIAIIGLSITFMILYNISINNSIISGKEIEIEKILEILSGFSLGAETIALFSRVGGGIYTKAADIGADLVGKLEFNIPEDDVRNPATIADNVGDNVGDIAGMGADLFGSYVSTIVAAMVLGREVISDRVEDITPIILPMIIASVGLLATIISIYTVNFNKKSTYDIQKTLNKTNWIAVILTSLMIFFVIIYLIPSNLLMRNYQFTNLDIYYSIIVGLMVGILITYITEYYTAINHRPVKFIVKQSITGHATNIIGGIAMGMESTALSVFVLSGGIYISYYFAGLYGVGIASSGMMATTAIQLTIDAFGPIADNAGGIAQMNNLDSKVRYRTDILDSVGNTTAASGKGFALASAGLTSLALFAAFVDMSGINSIDIYKTDVFIFLLIGCMIPFLFSSMCISAVGNSAMKMVEEVRKQLSSIKLDANIKPDYNKCIEIAAYSSLKNMMLPGCMALITPIIVGFTMGAESLGSLIAGITMSGILLGFFQSNSGGAWDNAKKSFEKGISINDKQYFKGSYAHKSSITGDTVGDPFKDTSGPSMNILIKITAIVSLIIAYHIKR
ncbi:MAG: sodium-translocating pyrophosphatase [Bacteroides sp.]|nr:MAG: sodium-translocating pyrophosphatase [Bacteroides sp.]